MGTVRRECLDWLIPVSESHLRTILRIRVAHYNLGLLQERGGDRGSAFRELGLALASLDPAAPERKAVIEDLLGNPSLSELRKDGRFTILLSSPAKSGWSECAYRCPFAKPINSPSGPSMTKQNQLPSIVWNIWRHWYSRTS